MRNLFSLLLVAVLVPIGAEALSAQQAQDTTTAKTTQATHHTRKYHRRHHQATHQVMVKHARAEHEGVAAERTEVRHARAERRERRHVARERVSTRTMMTMPEPTVLGTPAPGFPPPPQPAMRMNTMGASGISSMGRLQRLANGLITPDAARSIALRTIPNGTSVNKIRLRSEDGRQVYDVKVITPNQTGNEMVRVDAHTGAVVETKNVDNPVGAVKGAVRKAVNKVKHP